jgi:flagellar biogenesis protein FliO
VQAQGADGKPASAASGPQATPVAGGTTTATTAGGTTQGAAATAPPNAGKTPQSGASPATITGTKAKSNPQQPASAATPKQDRRKAEREKWQRLHAQKLAEQHAQALARQHAQQLAKQQAAQKHAQLLAQQHAQQLAKQQAAAQLAARQLEAKQGAQATAAAHPRVAAAQPVISVPSTSPRLVSAPATTGTPTTGMAAPSEAPIKAAGAPGGTPAQAAQPAASVENSKSSIQNPKSVINAPVAPSGPLNEAKPDLVPATHAASSDRPLDSPFTAVGDAWKMLAYLVPMLLLIVGSLRLLRRFHQRTGRLSGSQQAAAKLAAPGRSKALSTPESGGLIGLLMAGLQRPQSARHNSAIRLVETVPLGGSSLHLVQVHGRMLLLGASGGSVSLLTEFEEQSGIQEDDFRALLRAAAADMDVLDLMEPDLPATTMVTALEEMMQETGEAVTRRARRLRTVSDYESAEDIHA